MPSTIEHMHSPKEYTVYQRKLRHPLAGCFRTFARASKLYLRKCTKQCYSCHFELLEITDRMYPTSDLWGHPLAVLIAAEASDSNTRGTLTLNCCVGPFPSLT